MATVRASWIGVEVGGLEPSTELDAVRITRGPALEVGGGEPESTLDGFRVTRGPALEVGGSEPETTLDGYRITRVSVEVGGLDTEPPPPPPASSSVVSWLGMEIGGGEPEATLDGFRVTDLSLEIGGLIEEPEPPIFKRVTWIGTEVGGNEPEDTLDGFRITRLGLEVGGAAPEITEPTLVEGFFWDKKHEGWWADFFEVSMRPTCSAVFDADDPDDRRVAIGCDDGYLRIFDRDESTDDGTAIVSECLIGPISPQGLPNAEYRFSQLQTVMARDQAGATFKFYVSTEPDVDIDDLTPVTIGTLPPGLSPVRYARARGLYVWILIQGTVGGSWAYEAGSIMAAPGGRARQRE